MSYSSSKATSNRLYLLPLALLSLIILILLVIAIFILTPKIQNNLANQIQEELTKHSIPALITLSGRDVKLTGTVLNKKEKQKAESITKKICGIRFVENELLTEKAENLALIKSNIPPQKKQISQINIKPESVNTSKQKSTPVSAIKGEKTVQKKQITEPAKKPLDAKTTQSNPEQTVSEKLTSTHKRKTLDYDTMLAAMNAYQQQKGRNPKRVASLKILFKGDTAELLTQSTQELTTLSRRLQKSKNNNIEIIVSAKNSALALNRAKAIRDLLAQQGIDKSQMKVSGNKTKNDEPESVQIKGIQGQHSTTTN